MSNPELQQEILAGTKTKLDEIVNRLSLDLLASLEQGSAPMSHAINTNTPPEVVDQHAKSLKAYYASQQQTNQVKNDETEDDTSE